jgi:galactokinase
VVQSEHNLQMSPMLEQLRSEFAQEFGGDARLFRAPGRVNLIGEHTDYNDGFVMPAAIGFDTWVAAAKNNSDNIAVHSAQESQTFKFPLQEPNPQPRHDWTDYVRGVLVELERSSVALTPANLLIDGRVPIGAGLSSSAAIEVATAISMLQVSGGNLDRNAIARLCQRAENHFVGARCGIMDQFACLNGRKGHVILLDCRTLDARYLPLPSKVKLVICNTMVKHSLAAGEYNARRAQCEQCVTELKAVHPSLTALRDLSEAELEHDAPRLPELLRRRCRHVVSENARVLRAADALQSGDMEQLGQLMYESHVSLRDDYEVSCRELDIMVELARKAPGLIGARMTGGGFGGCAINLVRDEAVDEFVPQVSNGYKDAVGLTPEVYVTEAADGASCVD